MKLEEKKEILFREDTTKWLKTRAENERFFSDAQGMWCCCGALATGLHEARCKKFQHKVDVMTVRMLWEERASK